MFALQRAHIYLTDTEDTLVWDNSPDGHYSPKVGYSTICADMYARVIKWWWRGLWKIHCPAKNKLLWWAILENKISKWDNLQKHTFEGPG